MLDKEILELIIKVFYKINLKLVLILKLSRRYKKIIICNRFIEIFRFLI